MRICDPESGAPLGVGIAGEICVRGPTLFSHYDGVSPRDCFDAEGFFHTGDLGRLDGHGALHFLGRIKDVIKTAGVNVAAAEVEATLLRHPAVGAAHVVPVPAGARGEDVAAFNVAHYAGREGWMGPLAVRPDRQGTGVGKAVVRAATEWLIARGVTTLGLETMPRTPENIGFYARLGFAPGYLTVTLTNELPKPLLPVAGRPMIESCFERLRAVGVRRIIVNTHWKPEAYARAYPDNRWRDVELVFVHEPVLLETGGGLKNIEPLLGPDDAHLWVYNGDIFASPDLEKLWADHAASGAESTLLLRDTCWL